VSQRYFGEECDFRRALSSAPGCLVERRVMTRHRFERGRRDATELDALEVVDAVVAGSAVNSRSEVASQQSSRFSEDAQERALSRVQAASACG
jgi:hypothetical protein